MSPAHTWSGASGVKSRRTKSGAAARLPGPGEPASSADLPSGQAEAGRGLRDGVHQDAPSFPHERDPDLRGAVGAARGTEDAPDHVGELAAPHLAGSDQPVPPFAE